MVPFITVALPENVAKQPGCPRCGNIMRLIWTAVKKDDQEQLLFECSGCKNDVDILIGRDPV